MERPLLPASICLRRSPGWAAIVLCRYGWVDLYSWHRGTSEFNRCRSCPLLSIPGSLWGQKPQRSTSAPSEVFCNKSHQKGNCNIFQMSKTTGKASIVWESSGKEF